MTPCLDSLAGIGSPLDGGKPGRSLQFLCCSAIPRRVIGRAADFDRSAAAGRQFSGVFGHTSTPGEAILVRNCTLNRNRSRKLPHGGIVAGQMPPEETVGRTP